MCDSSLACEGIEVWADDDVVAIPINAATITLDADLFLKKLDREWAKGFEKTMSLKMRSHIFSLCEKVLFRQITDDGFRRCLRNYDLPDFEYFRFVARGNDRLLSLIAEIASADLSLAPAFNSGRLAASQGCHRILCNPADKQQEREWLAGFDSFRAEMKITKKETSNGH